MVTHKYLWGGSSFLGITHGTSAAQADIQTGYFNLETQVTCLFFTKKSGIFKVKLGSRVLC